MANKRKVPETHDDHPLVTIFAFLVVVGLAFWFHYETTKFEMPAEAPVTCKTN